MWTPLIGTMFVTALMGYTSYLCFFKVDERERRRQAMLRERAAQQAGKCTGKPWPAAARWSARPGARWLLRTGSAGAFVTCAGKVRATLLHVTPADQHATRSSLRFTRRPALRAAAAEQKVAANANKVLQAARKLVK